MKRQQGSRMYWTLPRVIRAVKAEARRLGRTPNAREMSAAHRAGRAVPHPRTVYERGLTLRELHRLADLTPPIHRGRGPHAHCKNGHAMTPENTYTWTNGSRRCRCCHRARSQEYRDAEAARRKSAPPRPRLVFDPEKAARLTAEKMAYWGIAVPRSEAEQGPQ